MPSTVPECLLISHLGDACLTLAPKTHFCMLTKGREEMESPPPQSSWLQASPVVGTSQDQQPRFSDQQGGCCEHS